MIVERGGSFWLNNRLHAKYYRFDNQVLVGSANMTGSGLGYSHHTGNLEILCAPGPPFVPGEFETLLKRDSRMVSDEEFVAWQQCPVTGRAAPASVRDDSPENDWRPQTRNPDYLWRYYRGDASSIVSSEQRELARLDLQALEVPPGLTEASFRRWILLCLGASSLVETVRQSDGQSGPPVWDPVTEELGGGG